MAINIKTYSYARIKSGNSGKFYGGSVSQAATPGGSSTGGQLELHYIWGQAFDGTQDITGDLTLYGNSVFYSPANPNSWLLFNATQNADGTSELQLKNTNLNIAGGKLYFTGDSSIYSIDGDLDIDATKINASVGNINQVNADTVSSPVIQTNTIDALTGNKIFIEDNLSVDGDLDMN